MSDSNLKHTFIGKDLMHNIAPLTENNNQPIFQNINYNKSMIGDSAQNNSLRIIQ
jgi:hypothetical protein